MKIVELRDDLLRSLSRQQAKRDQYAESRWIEAERAVMHRETNRWRATFGLPPVEVSAIERVERWACGHSDYSSKFALYCAEIACGKGVAP